MKAKIPMKKPKISFGILNSIKNGKFNNKLKNFSDFQKKDGEINDYQYMIKGNIVLFLTLTKNGIQKYEVDLSVFKDHSGLEIV